ncbi:DHA2 family efflux MFS transporter permease subunit [Saccharothrix algeriensis]|uniref:DHA2 family efflux MFS transporter permease subunit n=1 Tax=Saccharothrix algeriensis TaxID=173560 RepID=A0A8T8I1C6_9PSEU|nr:DHA2 family efflux MFS transporter permease subunit [Saccharothrix algeriensis]MBM7810320.1 DHA2 family lincomycin resistance protein-like MFS transporter [Saccharothrix algeriensis]QTR04471.1 DHA2 family efflux MFS transporter permease subunit [Saccharothrix algeriensis]
MTSAGVADAVSPPALSRGDRTVIGVLLVATFVVILNETIMGVALPVLLEELHVTASVGQWLTAGFLLTMSVVIPVTGYLIQRVPTRVLFGVAMSLFSAGTLLAALAPGFPVLMAARVVQACGTAIMLPLLMTTVMTLVPPARRGALMGNISIVISVAPAIGPTVSGVVLDLFGWRAMFWVVLPISLAALALGLRRVTSIGETSSTPIDLLSVVLSVFGFGGLVYGLSSIGHSGGGSAATLWVSLAVGVLGIAAFVLRQVALQRHERALLDLRTFAFRTFTVTSGLMMVMMGLLLGVATILPIYLQTVLGLEPLATGLLLLPGGLLMGLLSPVVGRLYDRVGPRVLLVVGTVATSASLWFASGFDGSTPAALVLVFHLVLSLGLAFSFTPLFSSGLGALPARLYSHGSAIFSTTQQLAAAAGVALLVSVMSARAAGLLDSGQAKVAAEMGGLHTAFLLAAVLSVVAVAGSFAVRGGKHESPA